MPTIMKFEHNRTFVVLHMENLLYGQKWADLLSEYFHSQSSDRNGKILQVSYLT